jgi:diaminopimelate dehydrogenase
MGQTVAVKSKAGVADALSVTIPLGTGIHRRVVYVQLQPGVDVSEVAAEIKADPYFTSDETHVIAVDDVSHYIDKGHGASIIRKGASGAADNQFFEFNMKINNPALTSQVMVGCARVAMKLAPGAYAMIEIAVVDFLPGEREDWIRRLV